MSKPEGFLPSRTCPVCEQTFTWKKKWSDCWHRVIYCGADCREKDSKAQGFEDHGSDGENIDAEVGAG